mgnify:FL=1
MYKFLRRNGFILPSVSTLKLMLTSYKTKPGYNKKLFQRLQQKARTMEEKEKKCILLFDEMDIKQDLQFSKTSGEVLGFENMGEFGSRAVPAKHVLILMARGIYCDWKLPISYYFTENGVKAEVLEKILKNYLLHL